MTQREICFLVAHSGKDGNTHGIFGDSNDIYTEIMEYFGGALDWSDHQIIQAIKVLKKT